MADPSRLELVVVAIPRRDERVWKVSSEPVPHMTLLYLGDVDWTPEQFVHAAEFIEHAASQLSRFGMSVERRGVLGDKDADVLFFDKSWSYKRLKEFRDNLLVDRDISTAYQSATQYPEWTPHLTLGYPETPAKSDDLEYGIGWVEFDQIALWNGESTGPTFQLKSFDSADLEVSMSTTQAGADFLEHYGVKGMKWGQHIKAKRNRQTEPNSADADRVGSIKSRVKEQKTTKILSNAELRDALDRMRLEQEFSKLSNGLDKTRTQKGKAFLAKLIVDTGKQNVEQTVKTQASGFVNEAIKNAKK
jgi:2'-5' RNA ligase